MKKYRCMIDFRGREKSWTCPREVEADDEQDALIKLYLDLHKNMKCAFRIWSIIELDDKENEKC